MIRIRTLVAIGMGLWASFTSTFALAVPFTPVLDELWIMKGAAGAVTVEIFRDRFDDGILPPSGPDGLTTYSVSGVGGITSEAAGKLTLTPSLGVPTAITTTFSDRFAGGIRQSSLDSADSNFLGQGSSIEIHALYDTSNLPMVVGQTFGVRATDRATDSGNAGDNTYALIVGVSGTTGNVVVALRLLDFAANTSTLIEAFPIESLLSGAAQIELILSKDADSAELNPASWVLYDASQTPFASDLLGASTTMPIYIGEDYIRAQFATTDRVPLPEPATLALLSVALAGLGFSRRRKLH